MQLEPKVDSPTRTAERERQSRSGSDEEEGLFQSLSLQQTKQILVRRGVSHHVSVYVAESRFRRGEGPSIFRASTQFLTFPFDRLGGLREFQVSLLMSFMSMLPDKYNLALGIKSTMLS